MILNRPRRNRSHEVIRSMVRENRLDLSDLLAPLFVLEGEKKKIEITSMPGQYRFSLDLLLEEIKELYELGIRSVAIFPALEESRKDKWAKESLNTDGLYLTTLKEVKKIFPELIVMSDVAMDPYSSDGHDGLVCDDTGEILNDETLSILTEMSIAQAKAGADIIGPSDMMDGRVRAIREGLERENYKNTLIMSYTAKYASHFYGPFRDALDSAPKKGDKKTYQMDYANSREALREAQLDTEEGADILMVKPGLAYLDIISELKKKGQLPIAAYNVSGEYAMIKAAAEKGWLDEQKVMVEMLTSFKRAGSDIILTYFAKDMARLFREKI
ncbi:MAG: porphobilinogen synthase [Bdellovibrionales bacterium]|jgi:porphobilinogen synthase|nr:porphobilinogen synthase [Bdellovibrionales bacterium]